MKLFRMFGILIVAVLGMGVLATSSASALLPDIHCLVGDKVCETGGAEGEAVSKSKTLFLESALGVKIEAKELKLLFKVKPLSALGTYDAHFTGVKLVGGAECISTGDVLGTVLAGGEFHLVFQNDAAGKLFTLVLLLTKVSFECGKVKLKVEGPLLGSFSAPGVMLPEDPEDAAHDSVEFHSLVNCKAGAKGVQEISAYLDENLKELLKQLLLVNAGIGFENACENAGTKEELAVKFNPMLSFLV